MHQSFVFLDINVGFIMKRKKWNLCCLPDVFDKWMKLISDEKGNECKDYDMHNNWNESTCFHQTTSYECLWIFEIVMDVKAEFFVISIFGIFNENSVALFYTGWSKARVIWKWFKIRCKNLIVSMQWILFKLKCVIRVLHLFKLCSSFIQLCRKCLCAILN